MLRLFNNILSILRGVLFYFFTRFLNPGKVSGGRKLIKFRDAAIHCGKGSKLILGKAIRLGEHSVISVLNGGELEIKKGVGIGRGNSIVCHEAITIGEDTILGPNVMVYDHDHIYDEKYGVNKKKFRTKPVYIGEHCWIGANAVILKGTTIGNRCVIGAGAVVKGNYPDNSLITQKRDIDVRKIVRSKNCED